LSRLSATGPRRSSRSGVPLTGAQQIMITAHIGGYLRTQCWEFCHRA